MTCLSRRVLALGAAALLAVTACGAGDPEITGDKPTAGGSSATGTKALTRLGPTEDRLAIVAWAGYAEDGSTDKTVDWVTPFEKETGCQVDVRIATTSEDMVELMRTGTYDVVSASGDVSLELIEPHRFVWAIEARFCRFGLGQAPHRVPASRRVALAAGVKPLQPELPNRLQHPAAEGAVRALAPPQQAGVN